MRRASVFFVVLIAGLSVLGCHRERTRACKDLIKAFNETLHLPGDAKRKSGDGAEEYPKAFEAIAVAVSAVPVSDPTLKQLRDRYALANQQMAAAKRDWQKASAKKDAALMTAALKRDQTATETKTAVDREVVEYCR